MYVIVMYDVNAKRTHKFRKLLRQYLQHTQYSVFSGDLKESDMLALRHELAQLLISEDRVVEITTANRHNVALTHLVKSEHGNVIRVPHDEHRRDFNVL